MGLLDLFSPAFLPNLCATKVHPWSVDFCSTQHQFQLLWRGVVDATKPICSLRYLAKRLPPIWKSACSCCFGLKKHCKSTANLMNWHRLCKKVIGRLLMYTRIYRLDLSGIVTDWFQILTRVSCNSQGLWKYLPRNWDVWIQLLVIWNLGPNCRGTASLWGQKLREPKVNKDVVSISSPWHSSPMKRPWTEGEITVTQILSK